MDLTPLPLDEALTKLVATSPAGTRWSITADGVRFILASNMVDAVRGFHKFVLKPQGVGYIYRGGL